MGKQAVGIEPSAEMREQAVAALGPERVRDGSVLALDFEDDRFAFAYAIEVFRYLDAADNAAGHAEIARVLRPGGVYYGTYVNRFALDGFRQLTLVRRLRHRLGGAEPACHMEFETPGASRWRRRGSDGRPPAVRRAWPTLAALRPGAIHQAALVAAPGDQPGALRQASR